MTRAFVLAMLMTTMWVPAAMADLTTYTYTGNDFNQFENAAGVYTTSDHITISFSIATLADNLAFAIITPISFSISDGVTTFTNPADSPSFEVGTGSLGQITSWWITGTGPVSSADQDSKLISSNSTGQTPADFSFISQDQELAQNVHDLGNWTQQTQVSPVPEPSSMLLTSTTLLALTLLARRRLALGTRPSRQLPQ